MILSGTLDSATSASLITYLLNDFFLLLFSKLIYLRFAAFLEKLTSQKRETLSKQSNRKRPCILLFHRNLIWSKPIRHKKLCVSSQRDGWGAESLDIWFSLFISFIVPSRSRQQLQPSYIDLGPQTSTCVRSPLPPLSSPPLLILHLRNNFFVNQWQGYGLYSPLCWAWSVHLLGSQGQLLLIPGLPQWPWITLKSCVLGLTAWLPAECSQMQVGAYKLCYIWHGVLRPSRKPANWLVMDRLWKRIIGCYTLI